MTDTTTIRGTELDDVHPTASEDAHTIMVNRVSWGAILAGVVVAIVVQVLLSMLGIGIGAATLDPGGVDNPEASTFSIVSGLWYAVSGILAAFAGGYIAARMSGKTVPTTGALHGLTTWAVTTILVLYLVSTSVGSIVGGTFRGLAGAVGGIGQAATEVAGPMLQDVNPLDAVERAVRSTGTDPEALQSSAVNAMRRLVTTDEAGAAEARAQAAQVLSEARGIPLPEAQERVAQIEQEYRQTVAQVQQTATQAADTAVSAVTTGALFGFVALVLGALAGWLGGRSGVVHPVYADRVIPSRRRI
jgi:hypothetical protein